MTHRFLSPMAIAAVAASLFAGAAHAQSVEISQPWVRATVAGQKATGAFMRITAKEAVTLVGASSPVASVTEVHEMAMDGGVMKMRAIAGLPIAAQQTVELKPGGYHVMLMDLKQPVVKDSQVPITLLFKDGKGVQSRVELTAPAQALMGGGKGHMQH